jgi:hypothetical protein
MRKGQLDEAFLADLAPADRVPREQLLRHQHIGRSAFSRRTFIGGAAGATGAILGSGLLMPLTGAAKTLDRTPKHIPGGTTLNGTLFHFYGFGPGQEPASITDFDGFVGVADVQGTGTATNPDGTTETLLFDTDMRFMKGRYVSKEGRLHKGTFGFV